MAGITPFNFPIMVPLWMAPIASPAATPSCSSRPSRTRRRRCWSPSCGPRPACPTASSPSSTATARRSTRSSTTRAIAGGLVRRLDAGRRATSTRRGTRHGKRVQALGGAKNHAVVLPDADLELAADGARVRRLRLGRAALHGGLGRRRGRRRRRAAGRRRCASGSPRSDGRRRHRPGRGDGPARQRPPTAARVAGYVDAGVAEGADAASSTAAGCASRAATGGHFLGPTLFDDVEPGHGDLRRGDLRAGARRRARARPTARRSTLDQRQPVRQRRGDLHQRRRRRARLRAGRHRRHGRHQRADPGADGLPLLRRLEGVALRRPARARPRRRALLHARQGRHAALAGPAAAAWTSASPCTASRWAPAPPPRCWSSRPRRRSASLLVAAAGTRRSAAAGGGPRAAARHRRRPAGARAGARRPTHRVVLRPRARDAVLLRRLRDRPRSASAGGRCALARRRAGCCRSRWPTRSAASLEASGLVVSLLYTGSALATTAIGHADPDPPRRRGAADAVRHARCSPPGRSASSGRSCSSRSCCPRATRSTRRVLVAFVRARGGHRAARRPLGGPRAGRSFERRLETSGQLGVRIVVVLVFGLVALAAELGLDILLGGLVAGLITRPR